MKKKKCGVREVETERRHATQNIANGEDQAATEKLLAAGLKNGNGAARHVTDAGVAIASKHVSGETISVTDAACAANENTADGDADSVPEWQTAVGLKNGNGVGGNATEMKLAIANICRELQAQQKCKVWHRKSRIMVGNRLQATVAGTLCGYSNKAKEADRTKAFAEADKIIKETVAGKYHSSMDEMIGITMVAVGAFANAEKTHKKAMLKLAEQIPVVAWIGEEDQRGFGIDSLATVIGETGDLNNYANPAKVWKRLGCAPFQFEDKTLMGATWRSKREGSLPAAMWEDFGYSPRRRSIAYMLGENLVKLNGDGPYRRRYDEAKAKLKIDHSDYPPQRCHRHGMLLATKLLLKNLWIAWRVCG